MVFFFQSYMEGRWSVLKKRFFSLFEAASFYVVYLVSGVLSSILFVLFALGWTMFEFYSNRMSMQSDVFLERVTELMNSEMITAVLLSNLVVILLYWLILWCRKQNMRDYAGFFSPRAVNVIGAVFAGITLNVVVGCVLEQIQLPSEMVREYAEGMETLLGGSFVVVLITVAVVAPFVEELVFRGALLRALQNALNTPLAVVISSLLFALAHVGPIQMTYAFLIGLILCLVRLMSGSLWCTVAMHVAFNAANYLPFEEALYGRTVFLAVFVVLFAASCTLACVRKKHP